MPAAAPVARTTRDRYLVPVLLAAVVVLVVGGALLKKSRDAKNAGAVVVASNPTVDSAAASASNPTPIAPVKAESGEKPDSNDARGDSVATNGGVAPPAAPAPASVPPEPAPVPTTSTTPPDRGGAARIHERRAEKNAGRARTAPPTAPETPPSQPPAEAPSTTSGPPANADQARARVDAAGHMIDAEKPTEAMAAIRGAMPLLPTRDDSVTALYYLARAMIQRSGKTENGAGHTRACSILTLISKATSHPKAAEIGSFSSQECK